MSSIGTGYDLSVTTFSPRFPDRVRHQSRRQQRHRLRHQMQRRSCYDDVAVLIEESAPFITTPAWLLRDWLQGRQIVARAKSEATNYQSVYGEQIPVKKLAECVASYMHLSTLYWWLRPFGCGIILGGYDRDGPQLYMVEPSGISYRYFGAAIGKGRQAAKIEIEKLKLSEMTCRQGAIKVAKIIYGVHDEAKDKAFELEMSWVCDESSRQHQKVPDDLLEEAKAAAKVALEEMDAD